MMQKKRINEARERGQRPNMTNGADDNRGWLVIQLGSAAIKKAWKNYSALELEACCVIWSLESLGYYLKGCWEFDLWTDHSPLVQSMKKELMDLTPRMQKFREAIQAYNVCLLFVKGVHNHIIDALS